MDSFLLLTMFDQCRFFFFLVLHRFDPVVAFACWTRLRRGAPGYMYPSFRLIGGRLRIYC